MECSELRATLNYRQVSVPRCPDEGGLSVLNTKTLSLGGKYITYVPPN